MHFRGDRVRALIQGKGWTQGELHVQARRHRPLMAWRTLNEAINAKTQPRIDVVDAIADALGVNPAYLLDLTDDPTPTTGESGYPVPLPDVAPLVERINALPAELRAQLVAGLTPLLDMLAPPPSPGLMDESEFYRLLDMWPAEEWPSLVTRFEAEIRTRERRARDVPSPGQNNAGSQARAG
jgi:transcriptional regulator with XRE-family HTH domain